MELSRLKREKVKKFRNWVQAGRPRGNNNPEWCEHKKARKTFNKELRRVSKEYENEQIKIAINKAEVDRGIFGRCLKIQEGL